MKGRQTHIDVAAYHEAGHAVTALKVGSYVSKVSIDVDSPGNGSTFHWNPPVNPFDLVRHPVLARQHTYKTSIDWMFISLAGPIAEAKLLRKPLRHLGSSSDYNTCMKLCLRLRDLAELAGVYTDTNMIEIDTLLDRGGTEREGGSVTREHGGRLKPLRGLYDPAQQLRTLL